MLLSCNRSLPFHTSPLVIGATGGSGTRVLRAMVEELGFAMGENRNKAGDSLDLDRFLEKWINPISKQTHALDYTWQDLSWWQRLCIQNSFKSAVNCHVKGMNPDQKLWGWKHPRSMFIVPVIDHFFPKFAFIHLIRDGRDMAISNNQNQRLKHTLALMPELKMNNETEQAILLWQKANLDVAAYGKNRLGDRYFLLRFEDLCQKPHETIATMMTWLAQHFSFAKPDIDKLAALIQEPDSIGRWQSLPAAEQQALFSLAGSGLDYFGYTK